MKNRILVLSIAFLFLSLSPVFAEANDKYKAKTYFDLLKKAEKQDPKFDFTAFRLSYTKTKQYQPYGVPDIQGMRNAYAKKDFKKVLSIAEKVLKENYTDIDAQLYCMLAYKNLGNKKKEDFHHYMFQGLLYSLLNSGDGQSMKTAFVVTRIDEEYAVMKGLQVQPGKQELIHKGGKVYDKWYVNHRRVGKHVLYFDISIPFKAQQNKMLNKFK